MSCSPSPAVEPRDPAARRAHRADRFAAHFAGARAVVRWDRLAVWTRRAPVRRAAPDFTYRQLVALEDGDGFVLGLGIVQGAEARAREVTLLTPLASPDGVAGAAPGRSDGRCADVPGSANRRMSESANDE